jgi:hypothetical protein
MMGMTIRPATPSDHDAIWAIMEPVIREGASYPLDPGLDRAGAFEYWFAPDKQVFVAEADGAVLGTYYPEPVPGDRSPCNRVRRPAG